MHNVSPLYFPAVAKIFDEGRIIHAVPDEIFALEIQNDVYKTVGDSWFACLIRSEGSGIFTPSNEWLPWVMTEEKLQWLRQLVVRANLEVNQGGHWFGAWGGNAYWELLYRDADGDLQFAIGDDNPWPRMKERSHDSYLEHCAQAMAMHCEVMDKALGLKPANMMKLAQGQTRPDQ